MEQIAVFEEKVVLSPSDFRKKITSFDDEILQKLKEKLEGKCSQHGFVKKESLELLSRSLGIAEKGRFTSEFIYYCKTKGIVYNPPEGFRIEGEVLRKNKMGLYVILDDAIRIMIPRDLHLGNDDFDSVEIGDKILIEIKKSRYQVNDSHILSIGQFIQKVSLANPPATTLSSAVDKGTTEQEAEEE